MTGVELIFKHFPELTEKQKNQFANLAELYILWNEQINVISRKDMDHFYERHVLHSLSIAKVQSFKDGSRILDIGTGGGFPGVPLAILFPECQFVLVDSIGKKIKVVNEVCNALEIKNVTTFHSRAEEIKEQFDFIVSRAVTAMPEFLKWVKGKFLTENKNKLREKINEIQLYWNKIQNVIVNGNLSDDQIEDIIYTSQKIGGSELLTRFDMQETPPDIFITNYSMLNN